MLELDGIIIHKYIKQKRKTLCIAMSPEGQITLKAPLHVSDAEAYDFVRRKKKWILKKLDYFANKPQTQQGPLENGLKLKLLGKDYTLIIRAKQEKAQVCIEGDELIIYSAKLADLRYNERMLMRWYLTKAEQVFHERLSIALELFPKLARPILKMRKYKSRWGSYASNHVMTLNTELIKADILAIDYVIIHELCHYYHKGHGVKFYDLLSMKMPNWKEIKKKLNAGDYGI